VASKRFGDLLREFRLRAGFSQEYLAERAHVSLEAIGSLERGVRRAPYPATLKLLVEALSLAADERLALESAADRARGEKGTSPGGMGAGRKSNLPLQLTPLVGREDDVIRLTGLLAKHRLVTVTGPDGIGKTRVALEAAERHARTERREVWLVDLSSLDQDAPVLERIVSVIGNPRSRTATPNLGAVLHPRRLLLVLDHCEHVIARASEAVLVLLRASADVRIIAASSEQLGVVGETLFRLPPLALPPRKPSTVDEAWHYAALALFMQRAAAEANLIPSDENLELIWEICNRLDGVPRAIELAASRLSALGLRDVLLRLHEELVLSGGGHDLPASKQRPLEAIARSYAGLSDAEQTLLRRLALFEGGATLRSIKVVCVDEGLEPERVPATLDALIHKSLVTVTREAAVRYRVLEVARPYYLERLGESGELARLSAKHSEWLSEVSAASQ
jgi:predicted ATPase/DNA-binding XRE family transcriptional regulator